MTALVVFCALQPTYNLKLLDSAGICDKQLFLRGRLELLPLRQPGATPLPTVCLFPSDLCE